VRAWWLAGVAGVALLGANPATAQIVNGDFSDGLSGWMVENPQPSKPGVLGPAHGWQFQAFDKHANIIVAGTETPAEEGHLSQVFTCGEEGPDCVCRIRFEYRLLHQTGEPDLATIFVYIDRDLAFQTKQTTDDIDRWFTQEITAPCGTREIALCLFVDTGVSGWLCSFDNVVAEAVPTGVAPSTWSRIKRLF